ncbi:MAG TPA: translation elongation factor Ts [Patescibacteria group bacterium]|nr:translation elongation factor Ts [Patescibacteria group bacterium]
MSFDTQLITQLREMTGAGIADCKMALEEANSDLEKAIAILRQKGSVKAAKKAERATNEGVIAMAKDKDKVALVGLACETDFVSQNSDFVATVNDFAQKLLTIELAEFEKIAQEKIQNELIVKIGENIKLAFAEVITGELIGVYLHSNKKLASALVLSGGNSELASVLAMQITAMSPKYVAPENIPPAEIEKEKAIYREQLKNEGKNEAMWDKIIPGKLNKYYAEVCLLNQPFIKDDKMIVGDLIKQTAKTMGEEIKVEKFTRYQI